jgi:hypothetical protein
MEAYLHRQDNRTYRFTLLVQRSLAGCINEPDDHYTGKAKLRLSSVDDNSPPYLGWDGRRIRTEAVPDHYLSIMSHVLKKAVLQGDGNGTLEDTLCQHPCKADIPMHKGLCHFRRIPVRIITPPSLILRQALRMTSFDRQGICPRLIKSQYNLSSTPLRS